MLRNHRWVRMNRHAATRCLRCLALVAGVRLPMRHPNMLQHTSVTTMLDAGVDLREVQIAARHAESRATMRYDQAERTATATATTSAPPTSPPAPDPAQRPAASGARRRTRSLTSPGTGADHHRIGGAPGTPAQGGRHEGHPLPARTALLGGETRRRDPVLPVPALSHRPHPGRRPGDLVGPVSPGSRRSAPVAERCKCRSWETTIRQTVHGTGQTSWRRWRRSGEERAGAGAATPVGCGARCRQRAVRASASPRRPASWWFRFWGVAADSDSSGSAAGQLLRRRGGGRADRGDVRAVDAGPVHGETAGTRSGPGCGRCWSGGWPRRALPG